MPPHHGIMTSLPHIGKHDRASILAPQSVRREAAEA